MIKSRLNHFFHGIVKPMPDHTAQQPPRGDLSIDHPLETVEAQMPLVPPFDGLLVLRGFACCMVIVFHCLTSPLRKTVQVNNIDLTWLIFSNGLVGVWIFFCLSGYLMGKAFFAERYEANYPGFFKFYRNRALRVLPLYYFVVFFQTVLVYPKALRLENWGYIFNLLTFNMGRYPADVMNGSLWSLSKEVQFYLIVPFIFLLTRKLVYIKKRFTLGLMAGVIAGSILFRALVWSSFRHQMDADFWLYAHQIYSPVISNLDLFLVSFLMNAIFQNRHQSPDKPLDKQPKRNKYLPAQLIKMGKILGHFIQKNCHMLAGLLIIAFYLYTSHHLYVQEQWLSLTRAFPGPRTAMMTVFLPSLTAVVVCLYIASFEAWGQSRHRMHPVSPSILLQQPIRIFETIGILSYGMYIWHWPILERIIPIHAEKLPLIGFLDILSGIMLISIIAAIITYYTVERPAARWKSSVKLLGSSDSSLN
jgi:peptidoglycan/LPS O-acetylase OafA/YrhL